jgi:methyl-accepting chemotaxis protein
MKTSTLVQRDFKLKFGLKLCMLTIAGMLALSIFIFFATAENLGGTYRSAIYTIYNLKVHIFPLMFASFYSIFILAVVTAAIAVIAVFFSHKIAGPIYRLEKTLDSIASGDLTASANLRSGDQLVELATEVNSMTRTLNHSIRGCGDSLREIKGCEERVLKLLEEEGPDPGELTEALASLKRGIEAYRLATYGFRVKE